MININDLYIMDVSQFTKDLYRMGNLTWPAFSEERSRIDLKIIVRDGIEVVLANGNGFSAFDHITSTMKKPGKRIWKILRGAALSAELVLVEDKRPGHKGHYMIAPKKDMSLKKFLGLLEELGMDRSKVIRVSELEVSRG